MRGGRDDVCGSSGGGDDACGSSGGGVFVEVVALCGVVMVWFGWVVVDYFGLRFGVGTICGHESLKGWLVLIRCLGCVFLHHLISCRFVLHFVCRVCAGAWVWLFPCDLLLPCCCLCFV
jgi:hypothetical protein